MTAPHFNGDARQDLKDEAIRLRAQYANNGRFTLPPELDEVVIKGVRYLHYPDGTWHDELGKEIDPAKLFPPPPEPDNQFPWLHDHEDSERLDFTTLADVPLIKRAWAVDGWFPMLETIGLGGPGGEGKTLLAQMFGTASALGASALGLPFEEMKATLVLCEDRHDDAYLRQTDINRHFGCKMKDLAGRLNILPRRKNKHNYLGIFDQDGVLHTTTFFDDLIAELKVFGSKFNVIDPRSFAAFQLRR